MAQWMDEKNLADDFFKGYPWESLDFSNLTLEEWTRIEQQLNLFFQSHTKSELYDGAIKRGIPLYPMNNIEGVIEDEQLKERDYWVEVDHKDVGDRLLLPGAFAKFSETPLKKPAQAPKIGQHNVDIYCRELGFSTENLITLRQAGII